jgi:hypothetical protein
LKKILKWVLAPVAVIWFLGWAYIQINYPTCTFRYKLTAEVNTPEGVKTGSSVIEVSYSSSNPIPNPGRWRIDTLTGEAVYIDLGNGKNIFITLGVNESSRPLKGWVLPFPQRSLDEPFDYSKMNGALNALWLPIKIFELGRTPGNESDMSRKLSRHYGFGAISVPVENLPTVVSFKKLADKNSVKVVDVSDLNAALGENYSFKSVQIELTAENPTRNMREILPWLSDFPEPSVFGTLTNGDFSAYRLTNPD